MISSSKTRVDGWRENKLEDFGCIIYEWPLVKWVDKHSPFERD